MKNYKFPINEKSQKLLEADMGEIEEEYENAHYEIYYRLKKSIEKMTNLIGDPEYFIFEHVADLKREIDLRKEKLKEKIDEICDDMIQKMEKYQKECYENAKRAKLAEKNAELIKEMQAKLEKWEDIDTILVETPFEMNVICTEIKKYDTMLVEKIDALRNELLMNKVWNYVENELVLKQFEKELILFEE